MDLKRKGVFLFSEGLAAAELAATVQRIERLGYGAVWFPEAVGREPFAMASFVLANTEKLIAATGIVNVYGRDAMVCAMGQQTLQEQSGGRFLLGLGVSHSLLVQMRGHAYAKPLATMRTYLRTRAPAANRDPEEPARRRHGGAGGRRRRPRSADDTAWRDAVILAALGPR